MIQWNLLSIVSKCSIQASAYSEAISMEKCSKLKNAMDEEILVKALTYSEIYELTTLLDDRLAIKVKVKFLFRKKFLFTKSIQKIVYILVINN